MIKIAKESGQGLENVEFVCADVLKCSIEEQFNTLICLGGSLAHFSPEELTKLIKSVFCKADRILIGQIDRVYLCFNTFNKPNVARFGDKMTILFPEGYSSDNYITLNFLTIENEKTKTGSMKLYLYNPGILKALMELGGFKLKKTIQESRTYFYHFFENYDQ